MNIWLVRYAGVVFAGKAVVIAETASEAIEIASKDEGSVGYCGEECFFEPEVTKINKCYGVIYNDNGDY